MSPLDFCGCCQTIKMMVGDWLISTGAAMPSGVVKGRDVKIKEIYHHHIILYSQSGIEHVHVQYKT